MKWWRKKRELFFQMNDLNNEEDEELFLFEKYRPKENGEMDKER